MRNSSASSGGKLTGRILRGEGEGHRIGYPTANLPPRFRKKVRDGIYACRVWLKRREYDGVAIVGVPGKTGRRKFEVHLIGFRRNIYGAALSLRIVRRIRALRTFSKVAALKKAIRRDLKAARRILNAK